MSTYLRLKDRGVQAALQHKALRGLPRLARGAFCAVYDKGDTVLKLTCDPVAYEYGAGPFRPQGEHFPRLVEDYFCIGETSKQKPLYLFEVEKLAPIKRDSLYHVQQAARTLSQRAGQTLHKHRYGLVRRDDAYASYLALQDLAQDRALAPALRQAVDKVATFASNFTAVLDIHMKNLMLRGDTLVLNDVLVDQDMLQELRVMW